MKILKVLALSSLCIFASLWLAFQFYERSLSEPIQLENEGMLLEVKKGESMRSVIERLQGLGVLRNYWVARMYVRLEGLGSQLKVGEFQLANHMDMRALFALLISNNQVLYRISLIEGSTFQEARQKIAQTENLEITLKKLSDSELLALLNERVRIKLIDKYPVVLLNDLLESFSHPEGLIYPDTYFYHKGDSDFDLLARAHQRLVMVLLNEWQAKASSLPFNTPYEALILASVIEKETGKPSERSEISGVFVRRLKKGMRLQTDPTVIYGLGDRYKGNITRKHLREMTVYNTYRINGLPPTPIALAGREAIHAALHPRAGTSLYFVAKGDGSHIFSETLAQHNRAVRDYQLRRKKDYRSSFK